jgi:hypothetical protein
VKRRELATRRIFWMVLVLVVGLLSASLAEAVIPLPGRTMRAIASVNRASGRTKALQLEMKLRIGSEPPIASAELISHPSGLARIEIRGYDGRIDRYLLSGDELVGTKNGERLFRPRPMLQPYFLLQASSESTLRTALETFGVRTQSIGLAPCGDDDCFVIGDPRLDAPLPKIEIESDEDALEDLGLDTQAIEPRLRPPDEDFEAIAQVVEGRLPRFWVDTRDLQVRRIDRADGIFVIFGPVASFEKIQVPSWFEIHDPGEAVPMRFEVDRAVQVNAPPKAFDRSWLIPPNLDGVAGEPTGSPD